MVWALIDVKARFNVKLQRATPEARWLWVCGVLYCQEGLTDGFIAREVLPFLGGTGNLEALAGELVTLGLWELCGDNGASGFFVHDYLKHQQSREQVEAKLKRRSDAGRAAANARWDANRIRIASESHVESESDATRNATVMRSRCDGDAMVMHTNTSTHTTENTNTSTYGAAPVPDQPKGKGKSKWHHGHFFCGDRICVPQFLWEEFDKQLGGADMVKALRWMRQLDERVTASGEIIEDPLKFVREAFREALKGSKRHGYVHREPDNTLDTCMHVPHCTSTRACQTLRDLEAMKEQMRHECTDSPVGRQIESAPVETGRSYSLRHPDAGSVRRT